MTRTEALQHIRDLIEAARAADMERGASGVLDEIEEAYSALSALPRVVVEVSGGVCTAIACDQPARVLLIDHDDIEAAGEDEPCIPIPENSDEWTRHVNDAWSNAENGAQK